MKNLTPVCHQLAVSDRVRRYGHQGGVIWMTGYSASGKSSLAMALEQKLTTLGYACYVLDADNIRKGLNADLGFGQADRKENIRRVGEVAALFAHAGLLCITAFISPYRQDRLMARGMSAHSFHEIYLAADLASCEARDPKGLYRKARAGNLADFTGISAPYEAPEVCELILRTAEEPFESSLQKLAGYVCQHFPLHSGQE